jgi:hypothetical protein
LTAFHHREQRRDLGAQWVRNGQRRQPPREVARHAARYPQSLAAQQRPDQADEPRPGAHQRVAHRQLRPHLPLGVGGAMRRTVGPQPAGIHQRLGIPPVGLHPPAAGRVHRRVVRVGDDHLVAEILQATGHPFALGRGLDQDPGAATAAEDLRQPIRAGADAALEDLARLGERADLTFARLHVDANVLHG